MAGIRKTGIAGLLLALIATMGGAQAADDKPLWEIGAGTSEIRRMIIARELMRDDFKSGR